MSAETRAWMQDYLDKITAKDAGGAGAYYADDLVAHFLGESQLAGDYDKQRFQATVGAYFAERDMSIELVDLLTGDNYAAAVVRNKLAGGDGTYEDLRVTLYRVGDRKIHEVWMFDADQRAFDAAVDNP